MLKTRVITAVIGVIIVAIAIALGGLLFNALVGLLVLLGWREYGNMLKNKGFELPMRLGYITVLITTVAFAMGAYWYALIAFMCMVGLTVICYIFELGLEGFSLESLYATIFGEVYILGGFFTFMALRNDTFYTFLSIDLNVTAPAMFVIWLVLVCTWASDTFAYFAGCAFGKHKIVPKISPNKTLEGFIGGFIGCILTGFVFAYFVGLPKLDGAAIGLLTGIVAPLGDLFESKIKRVCGVKDSGLLLPGHGGVLDRFDSLLFAAPVTFIYLVLEAL